MIRRETEDNRKKEIELLAKIRHNYPENIEYEQTQALKHFDFIARSNGKAVFLLEMRQRNCTSTAFPDVLASLSKYECALNNYNVYKMETYFIVEYSDGVVERFNLWKPDEISEEAFHRRDTDEYQKGVKFLHSSGTKLDVKILDNN